MTSVLENDLARAQDDLRNINTAISNSDACRTHTLPCQGMMLELEKPDFDEHKYAMRCAYRDKLVAKIAELEARLSLLK